jgi:lysophospholipase L1-like esterase
MKRLLVAALLGMVLVVNGASTIMKSAPIWDLAKDALDVSVALKKDGFIPLDDAHKFSIPHTAVKDSTAFTVEVKIRCEQPEDKTYINLLSQRTADTGWALSACVYPRIGSPITLQMNDASFNAGWFRTEPGQDHTFIVAARNGIVTVYWNGRVLKHFYGLITPNLDPIFVGKGTNSRYKEMAGVKLLSLKFWGPEEAFYAKNEKKEIAIGFRGGPGWLVSCPSEKKDKPLPRVLCYGDSILGGYGNRLRKVAEDKAYVYTWSGFIGNANVKGFNKKAFEAASSIKDFDYIVFNNGLHSLHWTEDKVTDAQIKDITRAILNGFRSGAPKAKIFWLATTPHTARRNENGKVEGTGTLNPIVQRINRLAAEVMAEEKVPVIDAYSLLINRLDLASGDCYHWRGDAYQMMAEEIFKRLSL